MAKKILITSNPSFYRTGFGKAARVLLSYLYSRKNPDGSRKWECVELAQGIVEGDPRLKALPWRAIGMTPADQSFLQGQPKFNGEYDPNLSRMINYGAAKFEQVIKDEKPFIFQEIEDAWGANVLRSYSNRPYLPMWDTEWWDKFHTILQTPLDSLPLFKPIVDNAHKIKNLFVKSSFAQKELHRLGHEHVGLWPCLMDAKDYRTFSDEEKIINRQKYGIDQDCLVFGMTFRNQGRKQPILILEAFKLFKEKYPEVKAKIIFITNPFEPGAWNIKEAIVELGLDSKDILAPHICHSCDSVVLKEIEEFDNDCPICNTKAALKCIAIDKGIEEPQLVEMYNLMNGYLQIATAGGFELPLLESALTSCYSASVNYAFGEMFVESGEVFSIQHTLSREIGTNFKRANALPSSICDFMEEIYKYPEESKKKGERYKEWAMKTIHPDIVLKKMEDFYDSLPEHNYDFNFRTEYPDPDAPFPNLESPDEFLKQLYRSFFGQDLKETDKNFLDMKEHLNRGATREQIYNQCKQIAENEIKKRSRPDLKSFFRETGRKKLLYELPGDFGDSLLSLAPLEALHKLYPSDEWDIYVSCLPQYVQIYEHLDFIAGFVPFFNITDFTIWEGSRYSDKIVDVWISPAIDQNFKHNGLKKTEFHLDRSLDLS